VLHTRVGSRPQPKTLDKAGKYCQGKNPLAYYEKVYLTAIKYFITLAAEGPQKKIQTIKYKLLTKIFL
jgi:hypothetical protein